MYSEPSISNYKFGSACCHQLVFQLHRALLTYGKFQTCDLPEHSLVAMAGSTIGRDSKVMVWKKQCMPGRESKCGGNVEGGAEGHEVVFRIPRLRAYLHWLVLLASIFTFAGKSYHAGLSYADVRRYLSSHSLSWTPRYDNRWAQ